jgi:hypothetical protein
MSFLVTFTKFNNVKEYDALENPQQPFMAILAFLGLLCKF